MKLKDFLNENYFQSDEFRSACEEQKCNIEIARAVLYSRTKAGISQTELARRVGVRQSHISKIENATANPKLSVLNKIFLELDIVLLLGIKK